MTIFIPETLKKYDINYVLVVKAGKKAFQEGWTKKEIKKDNPELVNHLLLGGNYGVLCGGLNHLVVIDFDNEEIQNKVIPLLPKTFTVKSGRGFFHKYFFSDASETLRIMTEDRETLADVQGDGSQVIGANSIHPNGSTYQVVDDCDIAFIPYSEIKALLMPYNHDPKLLKEKEKKETFKTDFGKDTNFAEVIKSRISLINVFDRLGIDTSRNPTKCPFHESLGGKCLGFNNETWHCFHCDESGNIFSIVTKIKGIDFKDALLWFVDNFNLKKEYDDCKNAYIEQLKKDKNKVLSDVLMNYLKKIKDHNWNEASELLVNLIKDNFHLFTTRDDLKSEVWIYDKGIYIPQGRSFIKEFLRKFLGDFFNNFIYNLVMNKIEPDTFIDADIFFRTNEVFEIPVQNGILNVLTKKLEEFTPDKIFFNKLPITYDSTLDCPMIDKFLNDVFGSPEDVKVFYELAGFNLVKDYTFEKAFMFVGYGRNGKSKVIELLKRFVGSYNVCSVPLSTLNSDSFSICELFGKLVNLAGDISNQDLKETGMFKQLTGRDIIGAKRKYLKDLHFVNYAKFVFACNELPMVYDFSRGFWDRWILINFPYTFVEEEEFNQAQDKSMLKLRDVNIIDKITSDSEMSGLLNRALNNLGELYKNRKFSYALNCETVKSQWIRRSNSFTAFCYDYLDSDGVSFITKKDLRRFYADYCHRFNISSKSDFVIKRVLGDMFGVIDEQKSINDNWENVWSGIYWKKPYVMNEVIIKKTPIKVDGLAHEGRCFECKKEKEWLNYVLDVETKDERFICEDCAKKDLEMIK